MPLQLRSFRSTSLRSSIAHTHHLPFPSHQLLTCSASQTGRPRSHRSPGRPRIPHVQLQRHDAGRPQAPLGRPSRAGHCVRPRFIEAFPLVHVILRAVLRCRHLGCLVTLLGRVVPSRQLPRCARGQPRLVRALLDRHDSRPDPVPGRHYQPVPVFYRQGAVSL